MTPHDDGQAPERVRELALPLVEPMGIDVLDVTIGGPGSRPLIRVIVDTADLTSASGVDVDDIATVSRRLGNLLDDEEWLDGAYTLEVTSPGADRPLVDVRDFTRNLGRDIRIERRVDDAVVDDDTTNARAAGEATEQVTGTLVAVDDDRVTLDVDGTEVHVAFAVLVHGKVVLPW